MSRINRGIHPYLEAAANEILKASMAGITKFSDKADILTPKKEKVRKSREILVPSGVPDAAFRSGMYHRRAAGEGHEHLNAIDGTRLPRRKMTRSTLRNFVAENGKTIDEEDMC